MKSSMRLRARRHLLLLLLTVPIALNGLTAPPVTRAEDIADVIADTAERQQALQARISRQQQLLEQLTADEAALRDEVAATGAELEEVNADQSAVRDEIKRATEQLATVQKRYDEVVAEIDHLDWTLGILEDELTQGEQDLNARRQILADRLADAYRTRQTSLLEQILVADSFADAVTQFDAHLRFGDQDAQLAAQIEQDQKQLEELRRLTSATRYRTDQLRQDVRDRAVQISQERERLEAARRRLDQLEKETKRLLAEQEAEFKAVAKNRDEAAKLLAQQQAAEDRLAQDIAALMIEQREQLAEQERLEQQRLEQERLERERLAELERLRREREANQNSTGSAPRPRPLPAPDVPAPSGTGRFIWPMRGVITQEFGCTGFSWEPPLGDCAHFHKGIDIAAGAGTPIVAPADATVLFVGWNPYDPGPDPAWTVILAHGPNLNTWYGHMLPKYAPGVRTGSRVTRGQVISYAGNTGHSTGVHLHWMVQQNGNWVNPRNFL